MFTREELLAAAHTQPIAGTLPMRFAGAAVDSRLVQPGQLFVALRGAQTDGHRFIRDAITAGAAAILCATPDDYAKACKFPQIAVPDPLTVLQQLARLRLAHQTSVTVIGITGSSGKTSTKEATASLLTHLGPTHKTAASFNTETGSRLVRGAKVRQEGGGRLFGAGLAGAPRDADHGDARLVGQAQARELLQDGEGIRHGDLREFARLGVVVWGSTQDGGGSGRDGVANEAMPISLGPTQRHEQLTGLHQSAVHRRTRKAHRQRSCDGLR